MAVLAEMECQEKGFFAWATGGKADFSFPPGRGGGEETSLVYKMLCLQDLAGWVCLGSDGIFAFRILLFSSPFVASDTNLIQTSLNQIKGLTGFFKWTQLGSEISLCPQDFISLLALLLFGSISEALSIRQQDDSDIRSPMGS